MANNTEELLTKYTLDPSSYVAGGQKVLNTTGSVISSLDKAASSSQTLHGKVLALSGALGGLGIAAGFAATAGLAKVTSFAIEQASSVQLLTARFAALNGNFDIAGQKLVGIQALGRNKSLFGLEELQNAGGVLEEAGLNVSRLLPLVNTLGNALGGTQGKALAAANALRNIAEGANPLRTLRQFGIGAGDFQSIGGAFSRNGKLVSDSQATFSEIEAIIKKKFGSIDAYIENTFARRVAGLQNSFDVAAASFGNAFLSGFGKVADNVGRFFGYLTDSSIAAKVGENLAAGFDTLLGKGDFFNKAISLGVATLEKLPSILSDSWTILKEMGSILKNDFKIAINGIGQFLHDAINSAVKSLYSGLNEIRHFTGDLLKTVSNVVGLIPGAQLDAAKLYGQGARLLNPKNDYKFAPVFEDKSGANTLTANNLHKTFGAAGIALEPDFITKIFDRGRDIYHGYNSVVAKTLPSAKLAALTDGPPTRAQVAALQSDNGLGGFFTKLYEPLTQIADATRITATNTNPNLKSFALGGGPLGQLGVTPVEFAAFRNQRPGAGNGLIRIDAKGAGQELESFIQRLVTEGINGYARMQNR